MNPKPLRRSYAPLAAALAAFAPSAALAAIPGEAPVMGFLQRVVDLLTGPLGILICCVFLAFAFIQWMTNPDGLRAVLRTAIAAVGLLTVVGIVQWLASTAR
jgi:type IV secretory pathway VirB2 component (pilin)